MRRYTLNKPIFLIGAARSGTTFLGDIIASHNDVAYWIEPKYIWNYSNRNKNHDIRHPEEATSKVKKYIINKFLKFVLKNDANRFLEKTPSNCFRIPFIFQIFPDGKFVNLIRDGRDVAFSAKKKWTSKPDKTALLRRLLHLEIPIVDLPFYGKEFFRDVIGRQLLPSKEFVWGPKFRGIYQLKDQMSLLELCAIQWKQSVKTSLDDLSSLPNNQVLHVKFEDILKKPATTIIEILDFMELPIQNSIIDYAKREMKLSARFRWKKEDNESVKVIESLIADQLVSLGYPLSSKN